MGPRVKNSTFHEFLIQGDRPRPIYFIRFILQSPASKIASETENEQYGKAQNLLVAFKTKSFEILIASHGGIYPQEGPGGI